MQEPPQQPARTVDLQGSAKINLRLDELDQSLRQQGLALVSLRELKFFRSLNRAALVWSQLPAAAQRLVAPFMAESKAQLGQDLFALACSGTTEPRFFVEFGATDGVSLSNTWLLEKKLGWQGILAEPAKSWHGALRANRQCRIESRCMYSESGKKVRFLETRNQDRASPELSTMKEYADNGDWASQLRLDHSEEYEVETISLNDLLDAHDAPAEIQFLSIDTEGSELEILRAFDFSRRRIRSICVEHNFQAHRQPIHDLLTGQGYRRVLTQVSAWDDWYVLA